MGNNNADYTSRSSRVFFYQVCESCYVQLVIYEYSFLVSVFELKHHFQGRTELIGTSTSRIAMRELFTRIDLKNLVFLSPAAKGDGRLGDEVRLLN